MENLLTVPDVADMLQLSRSKVYELKEKIGCYKIDGSIRFRGEDVVRYLEGCRVVEGEQKPTRSRTPYHLRHLA
jgi:excisionase family DNA binding protein